MAKASIEFQHYRHCVSALHAHLVFLPKYRQRFFTAAHLSAMQVIFAKICADFGAELSEFNGEADHVHVAVMYPPSVSLSRLVNSLKSVSSRRLRQDFADLAKRCTKGVLWSRSYFVASCGGAPLTVIKQYIEQQCRPS